VFDGKKERVYARETQRERERAKQRERKRERGRVTGKVYVSEIDRGRERCISLQQEKNIENQHKLGIGAAGCCSVTNTAYMHMSCEPRTYV